jgi:hypothetical protein
LVTLDLLAFAQPPRTAWVRPGFFSDAPALVGGLAPSPEGPPVRVFHTPRLMQAWKNGSLESEADYLLMRDFLAPSFGTAWGLQEVVSYQTHPVKETADFLLRLNAAPGGPLLDDTGARLIVDLAEGAGAPRAAAMRVRSNPRAKPRVFATHGAASVELLRYRPGSVTARVAASRPVELVLAETDYPGWRARVDGRTTPHGRYEGLFPSVLVPAGDHEVSFSFFSASLAWGAVVSAASLLTLVFYKMRP